MKKKSVTLIMHSKKLQEKYFPTPKIVKANCSNLGKKLKDYASC